MRVGYPCINRSLDCTPNSTFRLSSYSDDLLKEKVSSNLSCLEKTLRWNLDHKLLFFRIGSGFVPFASHPVCGVNWRKEFKKELLAAGRLIRKNDMRISMHPDQFVVLNTPKEGVLERSLAELEYHSDLLHAFRLNATAKIVLHVGGLYNDREKALSRFVERHSLLSPQLRKRLVIENDDRLFSLQDCIAVHDETGVPVVFDFLHHTCLNHGESFREALELASSTWGRDDGPLIVHYSSQKRGARPGSHAESLDVDDFKAFLESAEGREFDLMLEVKEKEKAALKALEILRRRGFLE